MKIIVYLPLLLQSTITSHGQCAPVLPRSGLYIRQGNEFIESTLEKAKKHLVLRGHRTVLNVGALHMFLLLCTQKRQDLRTNHFQSKCNSSLSLPVNAKTAAFLQSTIIFLSKTLDIKY